MDENCHDFMKYPSIKSHIKHTVLNNVMYVLWKLKGHSNASNGLPSKHKTFVSHLYNVGPTSKTLGRRCTNGIQMFCVYWLVALSALFEYIFYKSTTTRNSAGLYAFWRQILTSKDNSRPERVMKPIKCRELLPQYDIGLLLGQYTHFQNRVAPGPTGDN